MSTSKGFLISKTGVASSRRQFKHFGRELGGFVVGAIDDVVLPLDQPARRLGHGEGCQYAHDAPEGWVDQDDLGVERTYYQPVDRGFEAELKRRVEEQRARRQRPNDAT